MKYTIFGESEQYRMRILVVAPERKPQVREISDTLESMQQVVGGKIEVIYPYDGIALVSNRDGKNLRLPPNRELRDEDGVIYDIVCGTFFLCGAPASGDDFTSLTDEEIALYSKIFSVPKLFMNLDSRIIIFPCGEKGLSEEEKMDSGIRKLWLRLGATIEITKAEEKMIFCNDDLRMADTLRTVIAEGRFCLDGETYIPSEAVQAYNKTYGTDYEAENQFCDL